jgi:hypothetical protein
MEKNCICFPVSSEQHRIPGCVCLINEEIFKSVVMDVAWHSKEKM